MEDPVKLYVGVMAILIAVIGLVAWKGYAGVQEYERALQVAPGQAKQIRETAADVNQLCTQLESSTLKRTREPLSLIYQMCQSNRISDQPNLRQDRTDKSLRGTRAKERRFILTISKTGSQQPVRRDQIAKFCQDVERESNGILKTIELKLRRYTGADAPAPGKTEGKITDDTYVGDVVFGYRFVEAD